MPFQRIESEKLASAIVRQIEELIVQGILRPGERLPSERDLSERLGVSRPSLRDAIAQLQDQGLVSAKVGAGIFVADVLGSAFSPALIRLFSASEQAVFDYLGFRRDLEGLAAERAAKFASDTDLQVIAKLFERMEAAHSKRNYAEEAALDPQFHMAIIEASHNIITLHMMRAMFELLNDGVFYNRGTLFKNRATRAKLLAQHRAINDALQARDGPAANAAVADHLRFVEVEMSQIRKAERNEHTAQLRLKQRS
ncbi:FCD domain-containing protein [Rhodobacteraceae bacterium]|nr:FCD domain-containing protein [Paracoccaceae bacterium]